VWEGTRFVAFRCLQASKPIRYREILIKSRCCYHAVHSLVGYGCNMMEIALHAYLKNNILLCVVVNTWQIINWHVCACARLTSCRSVSQTIMYRPLAVAEIFRLPPVSNGMHCQTISFQHHPSIHSRINWKLSIPAIFLLLALKWTL